MTRGQTTVWTDVWIEHFLNVFLAVMNTRGESVVLSLSYTDRNQICFVRIDLKKTPEVVNLKKKSYFVCLWIFLLINTSQTKFKILGL